MIGITCNGLHHRRQAKDVIDGNDNNLSDEPQGLHFIHGLTAVLVVGLIAILCVAVSTLVQHLASPTSWLVPLTRPESYLLVSWPLVLWGAARLSKITCREAYPIRKFPLAIIPFLALLLWSINVLTAHITLMLSRDTIEALQDPISYDAYFLSNLLIVTPVAEELLFRGWMLHGFRARYGVRRAVLLSSFLFAIMHIHPLHAAGALVLGLLNGYLTISTGSLIPAILTHGFANSTPFVLPWLLSPFYDGRILSTMEIAPASLIGVSVIVGATCLYVLRRVLR